MPPVNRGLSSVYYFDMFIYVSLLSIGMCRFIYISTAGQVPEHERICALAGYDCHTDVYEEDVWRPVQ